MKILCVIDHPNRQSYNHAVMHAFADGTVRAGHSIDILDLNEDEFDPVMTVKDLSLYPQGKFTDFRVAVYQQRLRSADCLALFFPVWWMVMPARLKGWLDKVLLPGFAFTTGQFPQPLLTHIHSAFVFTTTAVSDADHRRDYHDALHWVLCKGTLAFIGIRDIHWHNFGEAGFASPEKHAAWLETARQVGLQIRANPGDQPG